MGVAGGGDAAVDGGGEGERLFGENDLGVRKRGGGAVGTAVIDEDDFGGSGGQLQSRPEALKEFQAVAGGNHDR